MNYVSRFKKCTGLDERLCKKFTPQTSEDEDLSAGLNDIEKRLQDNKQLEPSWFKKILIKLGFAGGKGSYEDRVQGYKFEQFLKLENNKDIRGKFVDAAKEIIESCDGEEFSKLFSTMKDLLGKDSDEWKTEGVVREAFSQRAKEIISDCDGKDFSKLFSTMKDLLGKDSDEWKTEGGVREAFSQRANILAIYCDSKNFSKFFSTVRDLLGKNSDEWKTKGGIRDTFSSRARWIARECNPKEWTISFGGIKEALGGKNSPDWKKVEAAYLEAHKWRAR
jgi:hypothetical protein